jgi:FlaA1/EpsC-like NDP-sugar epimerase
MNILSILGRAEPLFTIDVCKSEEYLRSIVTSSRFLVIGGAGSIGHAVTREIFKREPAALHVVDINENNLVELVRDLRSSIGYISGSFKTFAVDCGSKEFQLLCANEGPYDYIFNLSALKHVRSEKDPYTLMRMLQVNIFNTINIVEIGRKSKAKKYFCVSTDKAANPVNMMGASKRIMEMFLMRASESLPISMARFANVAFSDGSLLHGFKLRFAKQQPFAAPKDIRRYFLTPEESGELCLLSGLLAGNRDILFPKLSEKFHEITFPEIATRYLNAMGYEPYECSTEDEARNRNHELISRKLWPCLFFTSDTTGEKDYEEFFTGKENLDLDLFENIGVIHNTADYNSTDLDKFSAKICELYEKCEWTKKDLVDIFFEIIPDFNHKETGKYLDEKM